MKIEIISLFAGERGISTYSLLGTGAPSKSSGSLASNAQTGFASAPAAGSSSKSCCSAAAAPSPICSCLWRARYLSTWSRCSVAVKYPSESELRLYILKLKKKHLSHVLPPQGERYFACISSAVRTVCSLAVEFCIQFSWETAGNTAGVETSLNIAVQCTPWQAARVSQLLSRAPRSPPGR